MLSLIDGGDFIAELSSSRPVITVVDCKTAGFFFSKSVKKSVKRAVRVLRVSRQVSLSVFSLVPDLLFDCSRVHEYARIRTVLQSITVVILFFK